MTSPKKGWTKVAFGDVVQLSKERCADPEVAGFERYVGLDHLEPGDLKVRRWGDISDGTTFTAVFKPGQVLFGKRRAYQRKVAVADFAGVCSGDIYVLEPSNLKLLPELLPFICQTDAFFEHAVGTSAGSLSPRTNWKSLATFEFYLPPFDEQRRIAEALKASVRLVDATVSLKTACVQARAASREAELTKLSAVWKTAPVTDLLARATVGIVVRPAAMYVASGGVPALRSLNVWPDEVLMDDLVHISASGHENHEKSSLLPGDVVVVRTGRPGDAAVVPEGTGPLNCIDLIILKPGSELRSQFLCTVLNSAFGRAQFLRGAAGTAQQHFNVGNLRSLRIPLVPLEAQDEFLRLLSHSAGAEASAKARILSAARLHRALLSDGVG